MNAVCIVDRKLVVVGRSWKWTFFARRVTQLISKPEGFQRGSLEEVAIVFLDTDRSVKKIEYQKQGDSPQLRGRDDHGALEGGTPYRTAWKDILRIERPFQ